MRMQHVLAPALARRYLVPMRSLSRSIAVAQERERIEEDKRRAEEQAQQRLDALTADLEQIKASAADTRKERDAMRASQQSIIEKEIARVSANKSSSSSTQFS